MSNEKHSDAILLLPCKMKMFINSMVCVGVGVWWCLLCAQLCIFLLSTIYFNFLPLCLIHPTSTHSPPTIHSCIQSAVLSTSTPQAPIVWGVWSAMRKPELILVQPSRGSLSKEVRQIWEDRYYEASHGVWEQVSNMTGYPVTHSAAKNLPANAGDAESQEIRVRSLGREDPLE